MKFRFTWLQETKVLLAPGQRPDRSYSSGTTAKKQNSDSAFTKPCNTTPLERNKIHTENLLAQEFRLMR
jgi:hypothetical protein